MNAGQAGFADAAGSSPTGVGSAGFASVTALGVVARLCDAAEALAPGSCRVRPSDT